jgi:hypothetical protein
MMEKRFDAVASEAARAIPARISGMAGQVPGARTVAGSYTL